MSTQVRNSSGRWLRAIACLLLLSRLAGAAEPPADALRTWTSLSGKYSVRARLVRRGKTSLELQSEAGKRLTIEIAKLSAADRKFVARIPAESANAPRRSQPVEYRIRMGVEVQARGGSLNRLTVTFPLPVSWPEQQIEELGRDFSPPTLKPRIRVLQNAVKQAELRIRRLPAGSRVRAVYTFKVRRWRLDPPAAPERLTRGTPASSLRRYLQSSPYIETEHKLVRAAAESLELPAKASAWKQVETIYDWTRAKVKADGTQSLKGALHALETGRGDCEERTSLFVAMCRLKGIPARSVWIRGHAYPEFHLIDQEGLGVWIPCESLGGRAFGKMKRYKLIMQKGDNFRIRQQKQPQRYVTPTASGFGDGQAALREIFEQAPAQASR